MVLLTANQVNQSSFLYSRHILSLVPSPFKIFLANLGVEISFHPLPLCINPNLKVIPLFLSEVQVSLIASSFCSLSYPIFLVELTPISTDTLAFHSIGQGKRGFSCSDFRGSLVYHRISGSSLARNPFVVSKFLFRILFNIFLLFPIVRQLGDNA